MLAPPEIHVLKHSIVEQLLVQNCFANRRLRCRVGRRGRASRGGVSWGKRQKRSQTGRSNCDGSFCQDCASQVHNVAILAPRGQDRVLLGRRCDHLVLSLCNHSNRLSGIRMSQKPPGTSVQEFTLSRFWNMKLLPCAVHHAPRLSF